MRNKGLPDKRGADQMLPEELPNQHPNTVLAIYLSLYFQLLKTSIEHRVPPRNGRRFIVFLKKVLLLWMLKIEEIQIFKNNAEVLSHNKSAILCFLLVFKKGIRVI